MQLSLGFHLTSCGRRGRRIAVQPTALARRRQTLPRGQRTGGCHSHRLYSHSCDRTQSTVNGQTALIGAVNGQSGVKKTVNVQIPVRNGSDYSAVIRSEPVGWGYTCTERLFLDLRARGLGLQFKYRDSFAGKISERSKVNGQKLAWSTVKPPKRAGQSFDPRSQL